MASFSLLGHVFPESTLIISGWFWRGFFFYFEEPCLDVTWAQSPSYGALFKDLRHTSGRSGHFHECHDLNMSHDSANVCVDANYLPSPDTFCRCFYLCLMFTYIQTGSPQGFVCIDDLLGITTSIKNGHLFHW